MGEITLTRSQEAALRALRHFLSGDSACFVLKGSAGTGKTTLIASLMANLSEARRICLPLAPTGRAARILGAKTGATAGTVHSAIYALDDVRVFEDAQDRNDPGIRFVYPLKTDDPLDSFIVDESSMVGDKEYEADLLQFGSGRLLADLIEFARLGRHGRSTGRGARIIFVGDPRAFVPRTRLAAVASRREVDRTRRHLCWPFRRRSARPENAAPLPVTSTRTTHSR